MPNYFVCTYGNFPEKQNIIEKSLTNKIYQLHIDANYPTAMDKIQEGDIILLKDGCWIIAYGIASAPVSHDGQDDWRHVVHVDEWQKLTPYAHAYGIADNTICGGAMSVVKQVSPEWANAKLPSNHVNTVNEPKDDAKVRCSTILLRDLIEKNLKLPSYQRAYCWRKENIVGLLDGIKSWLLRTHNLHADELPCHLGTIILKEKVDNGKIGYDIIDGQQRLLTLAILLYCLSVQRQDNTATPQILTAEITGSENTSRVTKAYLVRAKRTIDEWIKENDTIEKNNIWGGVQFCEVVLSEAESEDLAYFFFNTTNSTGKRLSDYDLLKTHHLRYVPNDSAGFVAARWNRLTEKGVRELLHSMLYRLRHWSRNMPFYTNADETAEHLLFQHFSVQQEPLGNLYEIPLMPRFDSTLDGGIEFFNYVETYRSKFSIFEQFAAIQKLKEQLACHSNGVLYIAIKAVTFLFYCKFGEQYLNEALYCNAYRLSSLRNEAQLRRAYLSDQPIFAGAVNALDQATSARGFLAWAIDAKKRYTPDYAKGVKERYWIALHTLLAELEKNDGFSIEKYTNHITRIFEITKERN